MSNSRRMALRAAILLALPAAASAAAAQASLPWLLEGQRAHPERLAQLAGGGVAVLEPRPGLRLRVRLQPSEHFGIGTVWSGTIDGDPLGFVHLREERGGFAGRISTSTESLVVMPRRGGRVAVVAEAAAPPLPDLAARLPARLRRAGVQSDRAAVGAAGAYAAAESTFDVLIILDRRAGAESPVGMPWVIDLVRSGIVELNLALRNSGVPAQARLVKLKRDTYAPEGNNLEYMEQALVHLTDPDDEHFRRAHAWRERFGADFVALVSRKNESLCGLAWLAGQRDGVQPGDEAGAFSVTNWRCLQGNTLAHEIGHNMGLQHARVNPTSSTLGAYDDAFGHLVDANFSTVMAYLCGACKRVPYFSNPDVLIDGVPTGVAGGSGAAANAWSLQRDREVIAAFRPCRNNC